MEQLPYIDEHARALAAPPDRVWNALTATVRGELGGGAPGRVARVLRCEPAAASGDFARPDVRAGQALAGFAVAEAEAPRLLALRGAHRFSRYALTFLLEDRPGSGTLVRAQTHAAFPGVMGRLYRTAVIATGGHRLVVRRLLRTVERRSGTDDLGRRRSEWRDQRAGRFSGHVAGSLRVLPRARVHVRRISPAQRGQCFKRLWRRRGAAEVRGPRCRAGR